VPNEPKDKYFRLNLTLPSNLDSFLEDLGATAKSQGGHKLAKTVVIRALVRLLMELEKDLDLSGVKDEEELSVRIKRAIKKR
jgi:hypothetical protein